MFKAPKRRLQRHVLLRGKTDEENAVEVVKIFKTRSQIKYKKKPFNVNGISELTEMAARKNATRMIKHLHLTINRSNDASRNFLTILQDLEDNKTQIHKTVQDIEAKCLTNIKKREQGKVECLNKISQYLFDVQIFKMEREKQDILIRIGLIMESLLYELEPFDELLGNLALQEKSFKSKADTLGVRKNILMDRRRTVTKKLEKILEETQDIKQKLFSRLFALRESIHAAENTVHRLFEKEIKTMRIVLELENNLSRIRQIAKGEEMEKAKFYWFLDWVLTDVVGLESQAEITLQSSPQEKVQSIIESYKNLKKFTANRPLGEESQLVEKIF